MTSPKMNPQLLRESLDTSISEDKRQEIWQQIEQRNKTEALPQRSKQAVYSAAILTALAAAALFFFLLSPQSPSSNDFEIAIVPSDMGAQDMANQNGESKELASSEEKPRPVAAQEVSGQDFSEGARFSSEDSPLRLSFVDDTSMILEPHTELRIASAQPKHIKVELLQGQSTFDVSHIEQRKFEVRCQQFTVRVIGTQFTVRSTPSEERVSVTRGLVQVLRHTEAAAKNPRSIYLHPGEHFQLDLSHLESQKNISKSAPPSSLPDTSSTLPVESSADHFQLALKEAREKRRQGDLSGAIQAYRQLLSQYGSTAQGSTAQLEYARLLSSQAAQYPETAKVLINTRGLYPQFSEDLSARLIQVYAGSGQFSLCRDEVKKYIENFPDGVHIARVKRACP